MPDCPKIFTLRKRAIPQLHGHDYINTHTATPNTALLDQVEEFLRTINTEQAKSARDKVKMVRDDVVFLEAECASKVQLEKAHEDLLRKAISLDVIQNDERSCQFWTGFPNYGTFKALFNFLLPRIKHIRFWRGSARFNPKANIVTGPKRIKRTLAEEEEFFMTMIRFENWIDAFCD